MVCIFSYLIVNLIKHIFFKIYAWNNHTVGYKKVKPQTTDYKNISVILRVSFNVIKMQSIKSSPLLKTERLRTKLNTVNEMKPQNTVRKHWTTGQVNPNNGE